MDKLESAYHAPLCSPPKRKPGPKWHTFKWAINMKKKSHMLYLTPFPSQVKMCQMYLQFLWFWSIFFDAWLCLRWASPRRGHRLALLLGRTELSYPSSSWTGSIHLGGSSQVWGYPKSSTFASRQCTWDMFTSLSPRSQWTGTDTGTSVHSHFPHRILGTAKSVNTFPTSSGLFGYS